MAVLLIDRDQTRRDRLQVALAGKDLTVSAFATREEGRTIFALDSAGYSVVIVGPSDSDPIGRTELADGLYRLGGNEPRVFDYSHQTNEAGLVEEVAGAHVNY